MTAETLDIPVAVLAGGLATRLRPLTETVPKVLLEVAGKPFLEHQLVMLRGQGIRRVALGGCPPRAPTDPGLPN